MTSASICDSSSPALIPAGGSDGLRELAGQLGALGLNARLRPASDGQAPYSELTVTNPVSPRGQVHVTHDGAITWTCHQALRPGSDLAGIARAITAILVRPDQHQTSATCDGPHVISARCPLHCLKNWLPTLTFDALDRAMSKRFGGHPTVGHVLDMHRHRALDGIRGMGAKGITQIDTVLRLAGLPAQPRDMDHPASNARQPAPAVPLPSPAEVRAEHPGWRIEPTRGHRTHGYTATSHTDPTQVIRTGTLSEMQRRLRETPTVAEAISPQQTS